MMSLLRVKQWPDFLSFALHQATGKKTFLRGLGTSVARPSARVVKRFLFWVWFVALAAAAGPAKAATFEFALVGDNPYAAPEKVFQFEELIKEVNQEPQVLWVLHVGDIRGGSDAPCSNGVFEARAELFQRFRAPFIVTPGDNDWFDCGQPRNGGFQELERLRFVRRLFFGSSSFAAAGHEIKFRTQSKEREFQDFVENLMWDRDGIVFSTVHLVAAHPPPRNPQAARYAERLMDAALDWINETFARAKRINSPGVFIGMHADPWFLSSFQLGGYCSNCLSPRFGLERLYPALTRASVAFGRPVAIAVGDTHAFRVDKPLRSPDTRQIVENFTRVEAFGHPDVHWVRITVDLEDPAVFSFRPELVPKRDTPR